MFKIEEIQKIRIYHLIQKKKHINYITEKVRTTPRQVLRPESKLTQLQLPKKKRNLVSKSTTPNCRHAKLSPTVDHVTNTETLLSRKNQETHRKLTCFGRVFAQRGVSPLCKALSLGETKRILVIKRIRQLLINAHQHTNETAVMLCEVLLRNIRALS